MERGQLLCVLVCLSVRSEASSISSTIRRWRRCNQSDCGVSCVSDYQQTISCVLRNESLDKSKPYSLKFSDSEGKKKSCSLLSTNLDYRCDCQVKDPGSGFDSLDEYKIQLCEGSDCHDVIQEFQPKDNIKLAPPPEVLVRPITEAVNISVQSKAYEDHMYLNGFLSYELCLQQSQADMMRNLTLNSGREFMTIDEGLFQAGAEYCVKARFKPQKVYKATWSDWSKPVCWTKKGPTKELENVLIMVAKSLGPVCVVVIVVLFVFKSPAARMKIKTLSHLPSPAPFFLPLFQQHEGNLQDWLSPQGKLMLTYQTEKPKTEAVYTVVKLSKDPEENQTFKDPEENQTFKNPEENQTFNNPPAAPLIFPQHQGSSYVGLPEVLKGLPPVTIVCPGDAPYTQLPQSVWEFVSSPSKDFLDEDSGCSCEEMTQSLDCSLPSSPITECPPPCHCDDYCILNKTAEGVVPVLVSKEKVPTYPLQTDNQK